MLLISNIDLLFVTCFLLRKVFGILIRKCRNEMRLAASVAGPITLQWFLKTLVGICGASGGRGNLEFRFCI